MAETMLELVNVSKYYTGAQSVVVGLNGVSLKFSRGEFVAITGESGSGKSTLAGVLGGILPYESGELQFKGKPTSHYGGLDWEKYRRDNVSFISQSYGILPGATVMRNVVSALVIAGMEKAEAKKAAVGILRRVDLWELRGRRAAKLSSGQKQRLSIARALAKPAPILIADEPTGNLDAENSERIIELLADAAKERLVLLVTHDFDEAKDLATRHIVLQDGRVTADVALREPDEPGPAPQVLDGKKRGLAVYVAGLQCFSRPVWTAIMSVYFAATAFAVFAFLGVFISSLDDTPTRIYDDSIFKNGDPRRILVEVPDGGLDQDDYDAILAIPHVESIETWGGVSDIQYAYREGTDYTLRYEDDIKTNADGVIISRTMYIWRIVNEDAPFVKTVPMLPNGGTILTQGRLPENMYEIISGDASHKIGDIVKVFLLDSKHMNREDGAFLELSFQVVGLTDSEGLYFHDDLARMFRQYYYMSGNNSYDHGYFYVPNSPLKLPEEEEWANVDRNGDGVMEYLMTSDPLTPVNEGEFRGNIYLLYGMFKEERDPNGGAPTRYVPWDFRSDEMEPDGTYRHLALRPASKMEDGELHFDDYYNYNSHNTYLLLVDYPSFDILAQRRTEELGITITDYAYADRVLGELKNMGYYAISVFRQGSVQQDPQLEAERVQTLRLSIAVLVVLAILQVAVLRAMFSTETESYRLLSNIGLTGRTAKRSLVIQTAAFTLAGEIVGTLGILICVACGVEKVAAVSKYLDAKMCLVLVAVHMCLSAVATVWIVRTIGRQVYPLDTEREDIEIDDGEGAEAC